MDEFIDKFLDQPKSRTLLFCFAHPDDESFGPGGTIARYADAGVEVVLVCATLGEAGKAGDPPICTPEELPEVRRQELISAAKVLGISRVELLGYRDKELDQVPVNEGVGRIVDMLRKYQPEAIVTFPPGGISGHPDHLVIQRWTLEATGQYIKSLEENHIHSRPRLYYHTAPEYFSFFGVEPHHPMDAKYNVRVAVEPWIQRKIEALRCHRSQHLSVDRLLAVLEQPGNDRQQGLRWESYLRINIDDGQESPPPLTDSLLDPPVD